MRNVYIGYICIKNPILHPNHFYSFVHSYILAADYTKIQDSSRIFKCVTPSNIIVNSHEKQLEMFQKYYIELVTTKALGSDGPKLPDDCERELVSCIIYTINNQISHLYNMKQQQNINIGLSMLITSNH